MDMSSAIKNVHSVLPTVTPISTAATAVSTSATLSSGGDGQNTLNILFGVLAVVLALVAILIGWLQLRSFRKQPPDEEVVLSPLQFELVEIW